MDRLQRLVRLQRCAPRGRTLAAVAERELRPHSQRMNAERLGNVMECNWRSRKGRQILRLPARTYSAHELLAAQPKRSGLVGRERTDRARSRKAASGPAGSSCAASGELATAWMAAAAWVRVLRTRPGGDHKGSKTLLIVGKDPERIVES
jgi:hypothetical protein